jgi:hypothetical protein
LKFSKSFSTVTGGSFVRPAEDQRRLQVLIAEQSDPKRKL